MASKAAAQTGKGCENRELGIKRGARAFFRCFAAGLLVVRWWEGEEHEPAGNAGLFPGGLSFVPETFSIYGGRVTEHSLQFSPATPQERGKQRGTATKDRMRGEGMECLSPHPS